MNKEGITDMYLVAGLLASGAILERINSSNANRQIFIFRSLPKKVWVLIDGEVVSEDAGSLQDLERLFDYRVLMFPPTMPDKIKIVKSLVYREKMGDGKHLPPASHRKNGK